MAVSGVSSSSGASSSTTSSGSSANDVSDAQDRFLKLLVAQLNNQDPMNPMDNAELTSQMAQIQTVSGIDQLNTTMKTMSAQFATMQTMQGSSLISKNVLVPGDTMTIDSSTGTASGQFNLSDKAANVSVDVLNSRGTVLATVPLGTLDSGLHYFTWDASGQSSDAALQFRVTATNGVTKVNATTLVPDKVLAVSNTSDGQLQLQLQQTGTAPYSDAYAIF